MDEETRVSNAPQTHFTSLSHSTFHCHTRLPAGKDEAHDHRQQPFESSTDISKSSQPLVSSIYSFPDPSLNHTIPNSIKLSIKSSQTIMKEEVTFVLNQTSYVLMHEQLMNAHSSAQLQWMNHPHCHSLQSSQC